MSRKVALVLSGGGARGLAHIGVIEELEKRGYQINSIAGTSMGAFVGGIYSCGKMDKFKKWIILLDKRKIFNLLDFSFNSSGLIKGNRLFNTLSKFIPDVNIEELKIEFSATAADITNHKEVVYRSGSLYQAIRASIAIPTILTPIIKGNAVIVDGGVLNNIPLNNVKRTKGDLLVAVYVNADIPVLKPDILHKEEIKKQSVYKKKIAEFHDQLNKTYPKNKKDKLNYFSLIDKVLTSGMLRLAQLTIEKGVPDVLINISRDACSTYDFYKADELIEMGRLAAINTLDNLEI